MLVLVLVQLLRAEKATICCCERYATAKKIETREYLRRPPLLEVRIGAGMLSSTQQHSLSAKQQKYATLSNKWAQRWR